MVYDPYEDFRNRGGLPPSTLPPMVNNGNVVTLPENKTTGNWWTNMSGDSRDALFRSLLTAGNSMQQQADPYGQYLSTRLFSGIEKGINTYDKIRENQRLKKLEEYKQKRLDMEAQSSNLRATADYTRATAPTPAKMYEVGGGLFTADGKAVVPPPASYQEVKQGSSYVNKATGEAEFSGRPAPEKIFQGQGNMFYRYDQSSDRIIPLTGEQEKEYKLSQGQIVKNSKGAILAAGLPPDKDMTFEEKKELEEIKASRNPTDSKGDYLSNLKTIEAIIDKRYKRPQELISLSGGMTMPNEKYQEEFAAYEQKSNALRVDLMIEAGMPGAQILKSISDMKKKGIPNTPSSPVKEKLPTLPKEITDKGGKIVGREGNRFIVADKEGNQFYWPPGSK